MSGIDPVAHLMAICDCDEDAAIEYLSAANFDLNVAYTLYSSAHESAPPARVATPPQTFNTEPPVLSAPLHFVDRLDGGSGSDSSNFFRPLPVSPGERWSPSFPQAQRPLSHRRRQQQQQQQHEEEDEPSLLFSPPNFVHSDVIPFSMFCLRALEKDQWVILSIISDNFASLCVNRDIWQQSRERDTLSMFSIYQTNGKTERGMEVMSGYNLTSSDLPALLIVNPLTTMRVIKIQIPLTSEQLNINAEDVRETLLSFVAERGSPSQNETQRQRRPLQQQQITPPAPSLTAHPSATQRAERVIVDADSDTSPIKTTTPPPPQQQQQQQQKKTPTPLDISAYEAAADATNAFSIRCRLPKEQLTLRLRPDTPANLLVDYLAYKTYISNPEAYPNGVPNCSLKVGYPVQEVDAAPNTNLGNWGAVRSGDNVFLHIK